jgi:hypothetical protein
MPLIDVKCPQDHVSEVMRLLADWPKTPPCPECGAETVQVLLPSYLRHSPDPVVVFRGPDGNFRFPGDANGPAAARYAREGFERVELRGAADVRRFEKVMNAHEYSRAARRVEHQQQFREQREKHMRGELRQKMQSMSERGRELARVVMRQNDHKPRERVQDANFHVEVYSQDRSNRDESRDERGRRRRD